MTTIHTRQIQQYKPDNYNNTKQITRKIHTVNQQQLHTRQLKTSDNTLFIYKCVCMCARERCKLIFWTNISFYVYTFIDLWLFDAECDIFSQ